MAKKVSASKGVFLGKSKGGFAQMAGKSKKKGFKISGMRQVGEALYKKKNWKPNISV